MAGEVVYDSRTINEQIKKLIAMGKVVKIEGLTGQHCIAVGIRKGKTRISGVGGDYFGAFNAGGRLTLQGPAGRYVCDNMSGGEVIIQGHVATGSGVYMRGGNLIVQGNAGDRVGLNMQGGILVIDGYAGSYVGEYMQGGTLVITGNAGAHLGQWMIGGEIYVGGTITEPGKNTMETQATEEEVAAVVKYLEAYDVKGVTTLRKITAEKTRPFFEAEEEFAAPDLEDEDRHEVVIPVTAVEEEATEIVDVGAVEAPVAAGPIVKAEEDDGDDQISRTEDLERKLAQIRSKREKLMNDLRKSREGN